MKVYEAYTKTQCLNFIRQAERKQAYKPEHKRDSLFIEKNILSGLFEVLNYA
jgi:hypothetical protein